MDKAKLFALTEGFTSKLSLRPAFRLPIGRTSLQDRGNLGEARERVHLVQVSKIPSDCNYNNNFVFIAP